MFCCGLVVLFGVRFVCWLSVADCCFGIVWLVICLVCCFGLLIVVIYFDFCFYIFIISLP